MRFSRMMLGVAAASVALFVAVACGDGDEQVTEPTPTPGASPVISEGSVAPNVFMAFEGKRYRARDVGSDLVSADRVEVVGTTDEIDIEHAGPVEVYALKDGSSDVLYTFQPGRSIAEEEGGSIPDLWLEWAPEAAGSGSGFSPEPGVSTTPPAVTPGAQEPPLEAPLGEYEDDGSLPPVATPPPAQQDPDVGEGGPGGSSPDSSIPVEAARADLAQRLGVSTDRIEVVSVERVEWPDACLGAARTGEACAQVITPGYRVVLAVDGVEYVYHTDMGTHARPGS